MKRETGEGGGERADANGVGVGERQTDRGISNRKHEKVPVFRRLQGWL